MRPLYQISHRAEFAEVFFTDVIVPKTNLVGAINDGWRITMGALAHERGALWVEGVMGAQRGIDDLVGPGPSRVGLDGDPVVRRRIAELAAQVRALRAMGYKGFSSFAQGSSAPEHSFMKMATAEVRQSIFELGIDLQGPSGPSPTARSRPKGPAGRSRGSPRWPRPSAAARRRSNATRSRPASSGSRESDEGLTWTSC